MNQPLAVVVYQRLLPGSQLINRLQDLRYRVQALSQPAELLAFAENNLPILALVDMDMADAFASVQRLRQHPATSHLPVVGFCAEPSEEAKTKALGCGFTLVTGDVAITQHLPQLLQQALQVD
jgi:CheY-like chemotaxis protein